MLVIDDGSTDRTVAVARAHGADHILSFPRNRGLGFAIRAGFDRCLQLGADIVVNTDGDDEYEGADVPCWWPLSSPARPTSSSATASQAGCKASHPQAAPATPRQPHHQPPGARQRARCGLGLPGLQPRSPHDPQPPHRLRPHRRTHHPGRPPAPGRSLRTPSAPTPRPAIAASSEASGSSSAAPGVISLRTWAQYQALPAFFAFGSVSLALGILLGLRFLYFFVFTETSDLHVHPVVLAAIFLLAGFQMFLTGIVADLIAANRRLLEDTQRRVRELELAAPRRQPQPPPPPPTA